MTFEQWKSQVDEAIADRLMGLISDDLPDFCYAFLYADGYSPLEAALEAIENAQEM